MGDLEQATVRDTLKKNREEVRRIAATHGAFNIRVFGSAARGEARPESDVDLLLDFGPNASPWFAAGLILDFENLLGRRVQVTFEDGLTPDIRDQVLREAVPL